MTQVHRTILDFRRLNLLIALLTALVSTLRGNSESEDASDIPFEIRGFFKMGESSKFSVVNKTNGATRWIQTGQDFEGFMVTDWDEKAGHFKVIYRGQPFSIPMATSDGIPMEVAILSEAQRTADAELAVAQFEKKLLERLPPEKHRLYEPMRRAAENQIHAFRKSKQEAIAGGRSLTSPLATTNPTDEALTPAEANKTQTETKIRAGSLRGKTRVNNRVWASDHIEKFGLPETP